VPDVQTTVMNYVPEIFSGKLESDKCFIQRL
jgi:hypothetical protein